MSDIVKMYVIRDHGRAVSHFLINTEVTTVMMFLQLLDQNCFRILDYN